ncbi:glycosyltransferase [Fodinicola feengrottensis]|uniref:Glycosyltransferase family 1 protein n=1 Tax=Fodinicola feengrottensis TaxID=435914 RepID=A0ABN2GFQ6_9ACTN|nr:glycosyltransferase [Fodinicola feengrottensis]
MIADDNGAGPARIVRLANFVGPVSGGLRTALREWGRGYRAAGHHPVLIVPAGTASDTETDYGRVITVPSPVIPGTGGYRAIVSRRHVRRWLGELRPDRVEVHDRTTLRWVASWARARGVGSVVVSHERLDSLLRLYADTWLPAASGRAIPVADALNRRMAQAYDTVVITTDWASAEFTRLGVTNLRRVPLGVDLELFHSSRYDAALRGRLASPGELLVVQCTRLHTEKLPHRVIHAIEALLARGVRAAAVVAGDGPLRGSLEAAAQGLPIRFAGFGHDRAELARLLATADVLIAPGPVETFGLAALEALACGTPVVAPGDGALGEVVGDAGVVVRGQHDVVADGEAFADGLLQIAALPPAARRLAARRQAERFSWSTSVQAMLRTHGLSIDVEVS